MDVQPGGGARGEHRDRDRAGDLRAERVGEQGEHRGEGAGVGRRAAEVHWGVAGQMAMAWLVTIPAAGALAAAFYLLTDALGPEIAGPVAVSVLAAAAAAWLYIRTQRSGAIGAGDFG